MMGIGSLFCLSRGLSVLVEVVKMNGWERRESRQGGRQAEPCRQGALRRSVGSTPTSAGSGAGGCWVFTSVTFFDCRVKRSVWVSRLAERRAERLAKVVLTTQLETSHTLLLDSCLCHHLAHSTVWLVMGHVGHGSKHLSRCHLSRCHLSGWHLSR
jgi:hypothetical protein